MQKKIKQLKASLETVLKKPLPGVKSQLKLSPPSREIIPPAKDKRDAAVTILLYPGKNSISTIFIKRNNYDGPHSGQISFPGGKFETSDITLKNTAIREINEEIGTNISAKDIIGNLTSLYIPISKFYVSPFIAVIDYKPEFNRDIHEVQYLIELPLHIILTKNKIGSMIIQENNNHFSVPCFNFEEHQIWGATAMMLNEFIELLNKKVT